MRSGILAIRNSLIAQKIIFINLFIFQVSVLVDTYRFPPMPSTIIYIPLSYFPGTYNPISLVQTATVGRTASGAAALGLVELFTAGKLVFDAGVYVGALYVCAEQ